MSATGTLGTRLTVQSPTAQWQALTGAKHFEAALKTRPTSRSEHFLVHRVPTGPHAGKLSTSQVAEMGSVVDDLTGPALRLGMMVPKRHAKRAVTRNLVKRQIRAAFQRHLDLMPVADWVVRLRAPINVQQFPSARSVALARALREELDLVFAKLVEPRSATP